MSFKADYQEFLDEVDSELSKQMERVLKHGLTFAREKAPVGTYVKKSFWRTNKDGTRTYVSKSPKGYVPGAYRKSIKFAKGIPAAGTLYVTVSDPYSKYYIYTDSPYANCIEYGCKGHVPWSNKAPNGVFGITAESMRSRFGLKKT
jgi:hypothetical protein